MAVKPFSKDQLNFFKFSTLVLDEFPNVLRRIFITMWNSKVAIRPGFIVWDDSSVVRKMLLTSEGGKANIPTTKSIKEWDCTALFKATIYAKTFGVPSSKGSTLNDLYLKKYKPASGSFHSSVQSSTGNQDETYALAIDQLRMLRNTLCHSTKTEIAKSDFDYYVQLVKDALTAVNVDTTFVDVIGQMSEDDFPTEKVQELYECRVKELQAISMFHENVEQKLSSIEEKIGTMMSNPSVGGKENVPGQLPKPYIPSAVPLFTGREVEVEEITKHITSESTRLLNIWGSPGFGKTSTAIAVAHHLLSHGYSVYFFKLHCISTVEKFLSKILGIFKGNLADLNLTPEDKLVSIFREISFPIFLIFDNLDDLLDATSSVELLRLFQEFIYSNGNINILFTTREFLEIMRDQVKEFEDVRIRPLSPLSSVQFVRQLIPSFSEGVVSKVVGICCHVPLAMKLVASLVQNNSEDMANKILEELRFFQNLLHQFDTNMKKLFDYPFEPLPLPDKHALISLTVFCSATISKNAAIDVVSGESGLTSKAVQSLKTLVNKSLIDEDSNGEYYSIHPLIYSFVVDKTNNVDFVSVLSSSKMHFSEYYMRLFEKLNDDFLTGKSVDIRQMQDTMLHLSAAMSQLAAHGCGSFQNVFRILGKSEIFLNFLVCDPLHMPVGIIEMYDSALKCCKTQSDDMIYLKLYISKYFLDVVLHKTVPSSHSDIPADIRKETSLISDGSAAKLCCYEGISLITKGKINSGIELIEKHFKGLQKCSDQQIIKCLCLQLLALFYTDLKDYTKSSNFSRKAIEVCEEIGNCNLSLIGDGDQTLSMMQNQDKGEQLVFFVYCLYRWSQSFVNEETKRNFLNVVCELQKQTENRAFCSDYVHKVLIYGDCLLAALGGSSGQERLLDEKINFLEDSFHKSLKYKDCISTNPANPEYLSDRLLGCYFLKIEMRDRTNKQDQSIDTCYSALELSLQQYGKLHGNTVSCYMKLGLAERDAENYTNALKTFDQALEIMEEWDESSSSSDIVADVCIEKGNTYTCMNKLESAIECYDEGLKLKRKAGDEETEEISDILFFLGLLQYRFNNYSAADATSKQSLLIRIKCYPEKPFVYLNVVLSYILVAMVKSELGNVSESHRCLRNALELSTDCEKDRLRAQCLIYEMCISLNLEVDKNIELINHSLPAIKERYKSHLPLFYLTIGLKQLESGKYQAGVASLQKALDIQLDITLREVVGIREATVFLYTAVANELLNLGKSKLARRTLDRALRIAESLPNREQRFSIFRCYYLEGRIFNEKKEYVSAIKSLEYAVRLPCVTFKNFVREEEYRCRQDIAIAHFFQGAYKDALTSLYQSLSVIRNIFPDGSEEEADVYSCVAKIARIMKNRNLAVNNFRLTYKMYSKVLGKSHPTTEKFYVAYVRALIR